MRKRKVTYPRPKTDSRGAQAAPSTFDPRNPPSRTVSINLAAATGRASIKPGIRVRILSGLYAGEIAVAETDPGGVIPSVQVRTDAGAVRRCRTVDLEPITPADDAGGPSPE